jgi:Leucine-rich repeat (LRR) protein
VPALTELYLSDNLIVDLDDDAFVGLAQLELLDVSFNLLTWLGSGQMLWPTPNLRMFNANQNNIAHVPSLLFSNTSLIEAITLQSNSLTSLPIGIFDNLGSLVTLTLSYNAITTLDKNIFDTARSISVLDLGFNLISTPDEQLFQPLTNMALFVMNYNHIVEFPPKLLWPFSRAYSVDVGGNPFPSLHQNTFATLTNLSDLFVE